MKSPRKTGTIFYWFLTLKVKSVRYFSDKNYFFDKFCGFLTIFLVFLGSLNFFVNCKSGNLQILFYYSFTVQKCHNWNQRSDILQILIFFKVLKGSLSCYFTKHIFGVFHYFSHHGQAPIFFVLLLLSVQYLNLTISCVSWE